MKKGGASAKDSGSSEASAFSIFKKLCVDSCPKPDDEDLTFTTKQSIPESVSRSLLGPSHKKGKKYIVNEKREGPPEKHLSLKPTMEMKDSVVKKAIERKNEQTLKAEQEVQVTSEEEQEKLESENK